MLNIKKYIRKFTLHLVPIIFFGALPGLSFASLIGQDVTVTFEDDFGLEYDVVTVGAGPELSYFDGSNIGDFIFLDDEYIDIGDSSIVYQAQGGGDAHSTTGYQDLGLDPTAKYVFSDLNWGVTPGKIVGVDILLENIIGVDLGSEVTFTDNSVSLIIGTLGVDEVLDLGTITLNLIVEHDQPTGVPEPGSLALMFLGLVAMSNTLYRRKRNYF